MTDFFRLLNEERVFVTCDVIVHGNIVEFSAIDVSETRAANS